MKPKNLRHSESMLRHCLGRFLFLVASVGLLAWSAPFVAGADPAYSAQPADPNIPVDSMGHTFSSQPANVIVTPTAAPQPQPQQPVVTWQQPVPRPTATVTANGSAPIEMTGASTAAPVSVPQPVAPVIAAPVVVPVVVTPAPTLEPVAIAPAIEISAPSPEPANVVTTVPTPAPVPEVKPAPKLSTYAPVATYKPMKKSAKKPVEPAPVVAQSVVVTAAAPSSPEESRQMQAIASVPPPAPATLVVQSPPPVVVQNAPAGPPQISPPAPEQPAIVNPVSAAQSELGMPRFENWPRPPITEVNILKVPASTDVVEARGVPEASGDKRLFKFHAEGLELKTALALFARENKLNIVPDNNITGTVTLDVEDLPLDQMMSALLDAGDCSWHEDHGLIRIRNTETRTFAVDYLRLSRKGSGASSATLNSASSGNSSGGGSSGGSSGGGSSSGGSGGGNSSSSSVNVDTDNSTDFWEELKGELNSMLSDDGKKYLAINKTAGIIQVTDRPSVLKNVEHYLSATAQSIHRQVDIEVKIYDVTLNNQFQFGIDWVHVAEAYGGALAFGGATLPVANGSGQLLDSSLGGINRFPIVGTSLSTTPGGNLTTLSYQNFNTAAAINALQQQGSVEVISQPRIRTLNNQTAMIKVGEEIPTFVTSTSILPGASAGTSIQQQNTTVSSVTIGTILYLTPQISENDWISMDLSPVLTSLKGIVSFGGSGTGTGAGSGSGSSGATAADIDTKQASTLLRVHNGTTIILGGLIQTEKDDNNTKVPILGDVPLFGKLFTGKFKNKVKKELVMFVTPHIVAQ